MQQAINISIPTAIVSVPSYAEQTRQSESAVRNQINLGQLPVVYLNEKTERAKPFVNMLALAIKAANDAGIKVN